MTILWWTVTLSSQGHNVMTVVTIAGSRHRLRRRRHAEEGADGRYDTTRHATDNHNNITYDTTRHDNDNNNMIAIVSAYYNGKASLPRPWQPTTHHTVVVVP